MVTKNIIICSDGTGNSGGKGNETNVWRVFKAINRDSKDVVQLSFYDDGVGTESFKPLRIFASVFGYGLSRNVKQLYTEICRIYEPGDKLYFFGFSRGAFTVRTLLGWIMEVGLVDPKMSRDSQELTQHVDTSYKIFRSQFRTYLQRLLGVDETGKKFRKNLAPYLYALDQEQRRSLGHFIGVWDTVDAVGFPIAFIASLWNSLIYQFKFPNYLLNKDVQNAYHALAIDDERHTFHPLLWNESKVVEGQNLQQVWFAGMHSNVGGGYPQDGMAYVPLVWVMSAAERAGLSFTTSLATLYRERANPMEKLYNSRSGFGAYYRFAPRNLKVLAERYQLNKTIIHSSVIDRTQQSPAGYTPRHLPNEFLISPRNEQNEQDGDRIISAIKCKLNCAGIESVSKFWDLLRQGSQWVVVILTIVVILSIGMNGFFDEHVGTKLLEKLLAGTKVNLDWTELLFQAGILLATTFVLALLAENRANLLRSRFWVSVLKTKERRFR